MAQKKPLTETSIATFLGCGLGQAEYSLLSNAVAKQAADIDEVGPRTNWVRKQLAKAQERAKASAEYQKVRDERRSVFKIVELPLKNGQPRMFAINGLKKGRMIVDRDALDLIKANMPVIDSTVQK